MPKVEVPPTDSQQATPQSDIEKKGESSRSSIGAEGAYLADPSSRRFFTPSQQPSSAAGSGDFSEAPAIPKQIGYLQGFVKNGIGVYHDDDGRVTRIRPIDIAPGEQESVEKYDQILPTERLVGYGPGGSVSNVEMRNGLYMRQVGGQVEVRESSDGKVTTVDGKLSVSSSGTVTITNPNGELLRLMPPSGEIYERLPGQDRWMVTRAPAADDLKPKPEAFSGSITFKDGKIFQVSLSGTNPSIEGKTEFGQTVPAASLKSSNEVTAALNAAREQHDLEEAEREAARIAPTGDLTALGMGSTRSGGLDAEAAAAIEKRVHARIEERERAGLLARDSEDPNVMRKELGVSEEEMKRLNPEQRGRLAEELKGRLLAYGMAADIVPGLVGQIFHIAL